MRSAVMCVCEGNNTPIMPRHYVVNRLVARGSRLEDVSKWIGHRLLDTTYTNYYQPELSSLGFQEEDRLGRLLEVLQEELDAETFRRIVVEKAGLAMERVVGTPTPTPTPATHRDDVSDCATSNLLFQ